MLYSSLITKIPLLALASTPRTAFNGCYKEVLACNLGTNRNPSITSSGFYDPGRHLFYKKNLSAVNIKLRCSMHKLNLLGPCWFYLQLRSTHSENSSVSNVHIVRPNLDAIQVEEEGDEDRFNLELYMPSA